MSNLETALEYLTKYGFSVIPWKKNKRGSLIEHYKEYQGRLPTEEEVKEWWTKWPDAMIGVITGPISDLMALDFDWYKLTKDEQKPLHELVPKTIPGPICISPEGGHHRLFRYSNNGTVITSKAGLLKGFDVRGLKGVITMPPSTNEQGVSYRWMGGRAISEAPLQHIDKYILDNIISLLTGTSSTGGVLGGGQKIDAGNNITYKPITTHNIKLNDGNRGETLFHIVNACLKGGMPIENIHKVGEIICKNCNPPFEESEIPGRIKSALDRCKEREGKLKDEIKAYADETLSYFSVTNVAESIAYHNKPAIRTTLHRLVSDGYLEKNPKKEGEFRRIQNNIEEVNWIDSNADLIDVRYPFGIEKLVDTGRKSVTLIAGTSNAGKTAWLINFILLNMNKHKINYFSSEISGAGLKRRFLKFGINLEAFRGKFKFYERSGDFHDVVKPDEINIIDYLDISDEFYKIGAYIKMIFDKLNQGIALIALQKNPGSDYGYGGAKSIEKAHLYIALDFNELRIIKAKEAKEQSPVGFIKNFSITNGYQFVEDARGWYKPNKK